MFPSASLSSQKRKYSEYHDPDYPPNEEKVFPTDNKRARADSNATALTSNRKAAVNDKTSVRLQRIREIISREFKREITFKQQQLEEIDERLSQARMLLDRLRYAIVGEYYRKQELPLSNADAAAVRGSQTLFDEEHIGPQMALHPSLKKIIGKKPRSYEEILRTCPKRAAAKTAYHTIRTKSQAQRRQERRLQQLIREQGIVIDHSKQPEEQSNNILKVESTELLAQKSSQTSSKASSDKLNMRLNPPVARKVLNATRLNNKIRHLVVVGNTSKYIGAEVGDHKTFSHKWLVYVQAKEAHNSLETFVKKVRFFLHPSYRPNDVVDIYAPPFQIARRGWGEFPLRIQLFFHERLQQKQVQLVHNIVLDKTLSGLQTLGAETLVEIWLRSSDHQQNDPVKEIPTIISSTLANKNHVTIAVEPPSLPNSITINKKIRTISYTENKEELEDNLFAFLSKIDETPTSICADIEKIQPTVMVSEPLTPMNNASTKMKSIAISPKKEIVLQTSFSNTNKIESSTKITTVSKLEGATTSLNAVPRHTSNFVRIQNANTNSSGFRFIPNSNINRQVVVSKGGKLMLQPSEKLNIFKTSTAPSMTTPYTPTTPITCVNGEAKKILQKKLVQLVDNEGKIKYLQMLVATSSAQQISIGTNEVPTKTTIAPSSTIVGHLATTASQSINSKARICPLILKTNFTAGTRTENAYGNSGPPSICSASANQAPMVIKTKVNKPSFNGPKNVVFQKEGKLYIIDPQQMKIKQQQKKQISLLKPQVSLLNKQQQLQQQQLPQKPVPFSCVVASDHDYAPPPLPPLQHILVNNVKPVTIPLIKNAIPTPPQIHLGMRQTRFNANNAFERMESQRTLFDQQFLQVKFKSMRAAVEYMLRRLPLVANKESLAAAFPFIRNSSKEFQMLPAFKQRSCEWLRSKHIAQSLRIHQDLQQLHASSMDIYWSTREIATFARYNAYTPYIKVLLQSESEISNYEKPFTELVKSEIKQEQQQPKETLTSQAHITTWVDDTWQQLQQYENVESARQVIDVDGQQMVEVALTLNADDPQNNSLENERIEQMAYITPPKCLKNASQLVGNICKELGVRLQTEEVASGMLQPLAQTLLAHTLELFVEKLLRQAVASKLIQQKSNNGLCSLPSTSLALQDIGKVIDECKEFDFLTNHRFGIVKFDN